MYYTTNYDENSTNHAKISGMVLNNPTKTHQVEGENFYEFKVAVERLSKIKDIIPVTVSERSLTHMSISAGDFVEVEGEYRSYNKLIKERSSLVLHLFAKEIKELEDVSSQMNEVKLTGFVCKPPVYRKTPFDREICDVLIAVNRPNFHKSDYVPCIMWGRNARFIANQNVGCKIELTGRIQSREYTKRRDDGTEETKTAYEVSCQRIALLSNVTNLDNDKEENNKIVNWYAEWK